MIKNSLKRTSQQKVFIYFSNYNRDIFFLVKTTKKLICLYFLFKNIHAGYAQLDSLKIDVKKVQNFWWYQFQIFILYFFPRYAVHKTRLFDCA